ncbi:citrate/2-methylcitrate synthase, partial [Burkholderia cenocepacia]|nr:citrate/2-methylcitrate synthase [Burkholderia cenocepacia]
MDTTLDSSVPAAKTGDAPRNLLGRPTTRHRGTDIDGATLDPEALRVRDLDLNALIGATTFEGALAHLWFDVAPGSTDHRAHEATIGARLTAFADALAPGSVAQSIAAE